MLSPIAAGILLFTVTAIWRYRKEKVGTALLWYFFLVILILMSNVFELIAVSEEEMLFWTKVQHFVFSFLPINWLIFALYYSNTRVPINWRIFWPVFIIPAITFILLLSMSSNSMFYRKIDFVTINSLSTVNPTYGPWFWIWGVQIYALLISGAFIITRFVFSSGTFFRKQAVLIILGVTFPLVVNFIYILPLPILKYKDYTPLAFALSGVFFFVSIYWHKFLQIIPIVRNLVLDEMDMGILILDKMGRLVDFNHSVIQLLSMKEGIFGMHISNIPELVNIIDINSFENGHTYETVIADGDTQRNCDVFIKAINGNNQEQLGFLVTITDVTLRVKLIEEKMKLVSGMEKTNEELKTTQLRLIHREKLASIGQISAGVAHEIKNPLSFLQSNYRVLKKRILQINDRVTDLDLQNKIESIQDILNDSEEGFKRILEVVNNLLFFSRPQSISKKGFYDIHLGLDNTLRIIRELFKDLVEVHKDYGIIPQIECYNNELNQVFLNLLTNAAQAVKSCIDEKGVINIKTWENDGFVVCEISNNGPPIDPVIREKIFEPFYTTKNAGQGTGLGLSIAWDIIVKQHNGQIYVDSNRNNTVFCIKLPIVGAEVFKDVSDR